MVGAGNLQLLILNDYSQPWLHGFGYTYKSCRYRLWPIMLADHNLVDDVDIAELYLFQRYLIKPTKDDYEIFSLFS